MTANALIEKLRPLAASAEKQHFGEESAWYLRFIAPPDADYYFAAWIYDDGEACVVARRSEAREPEYFWSRSFELAAFDSQEELGQDLLDIVTLLLTHETRIVQKIRSHQHGFSPVVPNSR